MKRAINIATNLFKAKDKAIEKIEEMFDKEKTKPIEFTKISPEFEEGKFKQVLFKTKEKGQNKIRIMKLFRLKSVPNLIELQKNNELAMSNILTNFGNYEVSFVTLYAYKHGEDMIICYGILVEGEEKQYDKLEKTAERYLKALKSKFYSEYQNIELINLTLLEEWVFEGFHYKYITPIRGNPRPDNSVGYQTKTAYTNPVQTGKQVSEILLKGMTANVEDTDEGQITTGSKFMSYTVMDRVSWDEINRMLGHIQELLSQLDSSKEKATTESDTFSIPIFFSMGFGDMTGQSHGTSAGVSDTKGVSHSLGETTTVSHNETNTHGDSQTETKGTGTQEAMAKQKTEGGGGSGGINIGVNDTVNWQKSEGTTHSEGMTSQESEAVQKSDSKAISTGNSDATSKQTANNESHAVNSQESHGTSNQESRTGGLGSGFNVGDGTNTSYYQVDHFILTAMKYTLKYKERIERALSEGMYEYRMFVFTDDEQTKTTAEELIKQSYTNSDMPLPIKIVEFEDDKEKKEIEKYAKSMAKPMTKEPRPAIPEPRKYTTCITTAEASAFSPPQENLPGYISSYEPVPRQIGFIGKMTKGASVGKQLNPFLNVLSEHEFKFEMSKLGHIGFLGATGQGKSIGVQKFVSSVHNEYNMNFLLFDWTRNHRSIRSHLKDKSKFRYNSFDPKFSPLRVNFLVPPPGVPYYKWYPIISELLCYSMSLGDRSFRIIKKVMKKTKENADRGISYVKEWVDEPTGYGGKTNRVLKDVEREGAPYTPTMEHFVRQIDREFVERQQAYIDQGLRMPFNEQETFASMKERLEEWIDVEHPVYHSMCKDPESVINPFMTVEDMIKGDFVHLIECSGLPTEVKQFVINGVTAAIFHYCSSRDIKLTKPTYIIFEEAHAVLQMPTGNEPLSISETIFETINREARNYNLYIGYICQSPEKLPELIFEGLHLLMVWQLPGEEGKSKIISLGGKDAARLDRNLTNWLSRQPIGMCLVRGSKNKHVRESEFVAVKIDMLPHMDIGDGLFKKMIDERKTVKK